MEQKRTTIFIDIMFCGLMLPLIIMLLPVHRWIENYPVFASILLVYLYVLYYSIRKIHIPALLMKGKYLTVIVFISISLLFAQLLSHFPFETITKNLPHEVREHYRTRTVWLLYLVVIGFSLSIELVLELLKQILLRKDAETEKRNAELALYKAQINPHFLFNTLNSIYGLIINKSDRAELAFVKFTDIMQYMYKHTTDDTIAISKEIEYISHYIDLQSMRLNHHTKVIWEKEIDDETVQIPPMLLITFVENAFKYGTSPSRDSEIIFKLSLKDKILHFQSKNNIMGRRDSERTFVGLENCRSRLELLYPQQFTLDTREEEDKFNVSLTISLQ